MSGTGSQAKGFFGALFDFSFTSFVTLKFLKVIYGALVVVILIGGLTFFVVGVARGGGGIAFSIVVVPLVTLLYLVLVRICMELVALFFRIGEHTSVIANALASGRYGDSAPPSYGLPTPGPAPTPSWPGSPTGPPTPPGPPPNPYAAKPPTGPDAPTREQPTTSLE